MAQEAAQGVERFGETPDELDRYMRDQLAEYQDFIAAVDIYAGTALAFPKGYPVPKSTVEAQGYEKNGLVERVTPLPKATKSAPSPAPKVEG